MANGLAKGYTKVSNVIMETIMKQDFTKREIKLLLWVFRYGYGYNKDQSACDLDIKKIAHDTGLDRSHVWKTIRRLQSRNVIFLKDNEIRFNRHAEQWTMAETAMNTVRPKRPQNVAKTAMDHGQNGHRKDDNTLTASDIEAPKKNIKKKETPISPKNEPLESARQSKQDIDEIIAFLNETTGKSFKSSTSRTQKDIRARLNEGFTVEDFKQVIKEKSEQWRGDIKMDRYLRPETLFSNKFEGYLQESNRASKRQTAFGLDSTDTGIRGFGL
jgi:phage replication O-like protein O